MKVFLSWSGERSQHVAELLNEWLKCVIQACRPWVSTRDLDRGSLWFGEINDQLKDMTVGIICLTQENKLRPWILFEAGALAKGLSTARVCTLLIDLEPKDIGDPLAQFNHSFPKKESMFSLVRTLNGTLGNLGLDDRILEAVFDTYWPQFESKFAQILATTEIHPKPKPREKDEVLNELLESSRSINMRMRTLEADINSIQKRSNTRIGMGAPGSSGPVSMSRIRQRIEDGMTLDQLLARYSNRIPSSILMTEFAKITAEKSGPNEINT